MGTSRKSLIYRSLMIVIAFLISGQLLVGAAMSAEPATIGERILVDTEANHPRALHAFGKWHVSWRATDPLIRSFARQYSGAGIEGEEMSGSNLSGDIGEPTIAAGTDHILMVYPVIGGGGINYLVGVLFDSDGSYLGWEYLVTDPSGEDIVFHSPAVANKPGTNEFMIVYREQDGYDPHGIHGLAVNTNTGQIVVTGGPVEYSGGGDGEPDIAYGRYQSGSFYIELYFAVWRAGQWGISGQAIWPGWAGAAGGNISFPSSGEPVGDPAIAAAEVDGETPVLVTWRRGAPDMTLVAQRVRVNGELPGPVITVASGVEFPDVGVSDTEFLIAFREPTLPSNYDRILGRYYDFDGNALGEAFTIVDDYDRTTFPSVASDGMNYLVAYQTSSVIGQKDVALQRVGAGAFTFVDGDVSSLGTNSRGVAWGNWHPLPEDRIDLFIGNEGIEQNAIFQNLGDCVMDRRWSVGADEAVGGQGVAWADYDNDGKLDLYVSNGSGPNELYHWDPDGNDTYQPVGAEFGVDDAGMSRSIAWGDYDEDGLLDLYVGNKLSANRLYHNDGDGFTEVGGALGVGDIGNCEGVAFIDFDNDRDLDIYVGNTGGINRLFENLGGSFASVAPAWNLNEAGSARSVSWCDFDNDGDFDLYISKYNEPNSFYRNTGTTFQLVSLGLDDAGRGESACWADYDLDGDQDLFLANYMGTDRLFLNTGTTFTDIGAQVGLNDDGGGLGAAWADFDGDGDPDLCVVSYGGENRIFRNDLNTDNHWLKVDLEGVTANVAGIGARVRVVVGSLVQTQDVGGRNGYLSQNEPTLIFGLGGQTVVDSVIVRWPGSAMDVFTGVPADQTLQVTEGMTTTAVGNRTVSALRLLGGSPNPFNPRTQISFELGEPETIDLAVYDARGRRVGYLAGGVWPAGRHSVSWDGRNESGRALASGVYFVRLRGEQAADVQPVTLVR